MVVDGNRSAGHFHVAHPPVGQTVPENEIAAPRRNRALHFRLHLIRAKRVDLRDVHGQQLAPRGRNSGRPPRLASTRCPSDGSMISIAAWLLLKMLW